PIRKNATPPRMAAPPENSQTQPARKRLVEAALVDTLSVYQIPLAIGKAFLAEKPAAPRGACYAKERSGNCMADDSKSGKEKPTTLLRQGRCTASQTVGSSFAVQVTRWER